MKQWKKFEIVCASPGGELPIHDCRWPIHDFKQLVITWQRLRWAFRGSPFLFQPPSPSSRHFSLTWQMVKTFPFTPSSFNPTSPGKALSAPGPLIDFPTDKIPFYPPFINFSTLLTFQPLPQYSFFAAIQIISKFVPAFQEGTFFS